MIAQFYELNMDGLVGPTHHYAGLSAGNIASSANALKVANPSKAALQGIEKMRLLHSMGVKQAILPPHQRPNLKLLHQLGFYGTADAQLKVVKKSDPNLLSACFSASSMWTANAATVSTSLDTADSLVHFTAANLVANLHRQQETDFSASLLKRIFDNPRYFLHHSPLPRSTVTADEGAANHNRLAIKHLSAGVNVFVYGKRSLPTSNSYPTPKRFPARQTLEASQAIARKHLLNPKKLLFIAQNPEAIDQGVFHNDVIAVANENVLFFHEQAYVDQAKVLHQLQSMADFELKLIEVRKEQISLSDAVNSYLFNSQLITLPKGDHHSMALIAPSECAHTPKIKTFIDEILNDSSNPINEVHYLNLMQSMRNGGGPACLRLRVLLNEAELAAMHQGVLVSNELLNLLTDWVLRHYRTELHANDLDDPCLIDESFEALDELTVLLKLGNIYPFQLI